MNPALDLGPFPDRPGHAEAVALDATDQLAAFPIRFERTDPERSIGSCGSNGATV